MRAASLLHRHPHRHRPSCSAVTRRQRRHAMHMDMQRSYSCLSRGVGGEKVVGAGLARLLQQVRDIGQPMAGEIGLTAQLEGLLEGVTEGEAYTIQRELLALGDEVTSPRIGWKVGATAAGPQKALGLAGPFSAPLFERQLSTTEGAAATLSLNAMGGLGVTVETELGFTLRKDLPPNDYQYDYDTVYDALGSLTACVEVTARRVSPKGDTLLGPLVIADGGGCGAVVQSEITLSREAWIAAVAPREAAVSVAVDGEEVATGTGEAIFGDPIKSIQWLATQQELVGGPGLLAGEFIITGTMHGKTEAAGGNIIRSDFGPTLGAIEIKFEQ